MVSIFVVFSRQTKVCILRPYFVLGFIKIIKNSAKIILCSKLEEKGSEHENITNIFEIPKYSK